MATKIWNGSTSTAWSAADNWTPSGVPVNGDDVIFDDSGSENVLGGLDQSAVTLNSLRIKKSYTGRIGTPSSPLEIGAGDVIIGENFTRSTVSGPGYINLDLGSNAADVTVYDTGTPYYSGRKALNITANNAATVLKARSGEISVAGETGETAVLGTIIQSYDDSRANDVKLLLGPGVTLTTLRKYGGEAVVLCGLTNLYNHDGFCWIFGSPVITNLYVFGGSVEHSSTGTLTLLAMTGGKCDFSRLMEARTVTSILMNPGAVVSYDPQFLTITNKIDDYDFGERITFIAQKY